MVFTLTGQHRCAVYEIRLIIHFFQFQAFIHHLHSLLSSVAAVLSELDPSLSEQLLQFLLQSHVCSFQAFHNFRGPQKVLLHPLIRPACQTHNSRDREHVWNTFITRECCSLICYKYLTNTAFRHFSKVKCIQVHPEFIQQFSDDPAMAGHVLDENNLEHWEVIKDFVKSRELYNLHISALR